jgi:hypothetical protein
LQQALSAHKQKLTGLQQQDKTGRNALVTAQRKRIEFLEDLIAGGVQCLQERKGS